jgi:hypothetical protein
MATSRMKKIERLAGELRELLGDQDAIAIAEHYGIRVDQVDRYDARIGCSIRDVAKANMEKWGEW